MKDLLLYGFNYYDVALLLQRVVMGVFFVSYRFRLVFDPSQSEDKWFSHARKVKLQERLCSCGYGNSISLCALVAAVEILGGLGLIVGLLTVPAAVGILIVMLFANYCTPQEFIPDMHPVDKIDWVSCYFRLVEPLYLLLALMVILQGPGAYSLDVLLLGAH